MSEEIQEETVIEIDEENEDNDIVIQMNTGDGESSFQTEKIEGELEAVIISVDDSLGRVGIRIDSELGYNILDIKEFPINLGDPNTRYIPIRTQALNELGRQFGFGFEEFCLNEKLTFSIYGPKNKAVKFILRSK